MLLKPIKFVAAAATLTAVTAGNNSRARASRAGLGLLL
jgi:hypothetical protein